MCSASLGVVPLMICSPPIGTTCSTRQRLSAGPRVQNQNKGGADLEDDSGALEGFAVGALAQLAHRLGALLALGAALGPRLRRLQPALQRIGHRKHVGTALAAQPQQAVQRAQRLIGGRVGEHAGRVLKVLRKRHSLGGVCLCTGVLILVDHRFASRGQRRAHRRAAQRRAQRVGAQRRARQRLSRSSLVVIIIIGSRLLSQSINLVVHVIGQL